MAERKLRDTFDEDNSPSKRVTRSAATLKTVQPVVLIDASTPTRRRSGQTDTPVTPRAPPLRRPCPRGTKALDSSSHKENENSDKEDNDDSDADELNIGPENKELEVNEKEVKKPKRVVFDSIVITSPTKTKRNNQTRKAQPIAPSIRLPDFGPSQSSPIKKLTTKDKAPSSPIKPRRDEALSDSAGNIEAKKVVNLPIPLPLHLQPCLNAQKRAILDALLDPTLGGQHDVDDEGPTANVVALQQLTSLVGGTVKRTEGNSCLVIGPAGSGKTKIFERALLEYVEEKPIVIRLNGHVQRTDRQAMREIARQVVEQTGSDKFNSLAYDDVENPFIDDGNHEADTEGFSSTLPPSAHLPSLISALPTLSRPVIVLLDGFDLFAHHPRQALLYCLLDTVQSCRAGSDTQRGLAVIGLTSRVDVMNLLEKRVKSRFSHRTFRTAALRKVDEWIDLLRTCLNAQFDSTMFSIDRSTVEEWRRIWIQAVKSFVDERSLKDLLQDIFGITRDIRVLQRVMTDAICDLSAGSPYLSLNYMRSHIESQRSIPQADVLSKLNYPALSMLIAAEHMRTAGHDTFTFEMLRDAFRIQVRTSSAAPVMIGGSSIGMMNVGRGVLMGAFENLVRMRIFVLAAPSTAGSAKEFVKYRSLIMREDVKRAVDSVGQTNLRKWFYKAH